MSGSVSQSDSVEDFGDPGDSGDSAEEHSTPSVLAPLVRVVGIFSLLTVWAVGVAIAYAYGGDYGLTAWIRLPEGLAPFQTLDLEMADVIAYAALFVAILLAATVQLNSTVSAADSISDQRPSSREEARAQQRDLQNYANQAELALLVSFGSAFAVLLLTVLFGLAEIAGADTGTDTGVVDSHGVGWPGFIEALPGLFHPRIMFMYLVSFLLFVTTVASMPEWKSTGLFQRQVEANAWQARDRLARIADEHDLDDVDAIRLPAGMRIAALAGYLAYFSAFALVLNLSLSLFAGDEGFRGVFAAGHFPLFIGFTIIAGLLSHGVGSVMLRIFHLHGGRSAFSVVSIVLLFAAVLFVVWAEGIGWTVGFAVVIVAYLALWVLLFWRGAGVLDEKTPATWEFFINPPKFTVVRRYETIRRAAATLEER